MDLTQALKREYATLWKSCAINPSHASEVDGIVDRIAAGKKRYAAIGRANGGVPWHVVGILHMMESSCNFHEHLHNGDPLTARTVQNPAGRPKHGNPPFTFEQSAADALAIDGLTTWKDWSVSGTLFIFERYNGFGYRPHGINSPYLWSFSNQYSKGKFTKDNVFDPGVPSGQAGTAVILKRMAARKLTAVGAAKNGAAGGGGSDPGFIEKGAKGPRVMTLKKLLKGWFDAHLPGTWEVLDIAPNNVFGDNLDRAVRLFQSKVGIEVDGRAGKDTFDALRANANVVPHAPFADLVFPHGMKRGASGAKVTLVQGWLNLHGNTVNVTGDFLGETERQAREFQRAHGLPPTGVVDEATWAALVRPMNLALRPIANVRPLSKLVVAYARQHVAQNPREVGGANRGPWVRLYGRGKDGFFWCAAFASFVVNQAATTLGVPSPVPLTDLCDDFDGGPGFVKGTANGPSRPLRPGGLFLVLDAAGSFPKYKHCGITLAQTGTGIDTIGGNTSVDGLSENGTGVFKGHRRFAGLDFVNL